MTILYGKSEKSDNEEFNLDIDFFSLPHTLNLFFKSPQVLQDKAELYQLGTLLQVDLSIFNTLFYKSNPPSLAWQKVSILQEKINEVLWELENHPLFWRPLQKQRTIWRDYFKDKKGFYQDLKDLSQNLDSLSDQGLEWITFYEI